MTVAGPVRAQPLLRPPVLVPTDPAAESLTAVLRHWTDVIDTVLPGVLADRDVEYLHEMRTAVRATRSMLTLGGDLLTPDVALFAAEFRWLGRITAPVRDLDVATLELDGRGRLDLQGLDHLEPVQAYLAQRRRPALRTLRAALQSPRGSALTGKWRRALASASSSDIATSTTDAAVDHARLAYRGIVKASAGVDARTPAEQLHRLRRRCKRMRYLLDGYATVFAPEPHGDLLTSLKKLQNCLGDIQDVDVQRNELARIAAALTRRGASPEVILSIGALRDRSLRRDAAARTRLLPQLDRFRASDTRARLRALGQATASAAREGTKNSAESIDAR